MTDTKTNAEIVENARAADIEMFRQYGDRMVVIDYDNGSATYSGEIWNVGEQFVDLRGVRRFDVDISTMERTRSQLQRYFEERAGVPDQMLNRSKIDRIVDSDFFTSKFRNETQ